MCWNVHLISRRPCTQGDSNRHTQHDLREVANSVCAAAWLTELCSDTYTCRSTRLCTAPFADGLSLSHSSLDLEAKQDAEAVSADLGAARLARPPRRPAAGDTHPNRRVHHHLGWHAVIVFLQNLHALPASCQPPASAPALACFASMLSSHT